MARAQAGDQAAYGRLLKAMLPLIQSLARRKVGDDGLVDDVVQDALMTIHAVRHTYDPARPILPWVAAIVSARAVDALRRRGRHRRREVQDEGALLAAVDAGAFARVEGGHGGNWMASLAACRPGSARSSNLSICGR